jgi:hypothetical protein
MDSDTSLLEAGTAGIKMGLNVAETVAGAGLDGFVLAKVGKP